jgi:hypothetical protein
MREKSFFSPRNWTQGFVLDRRVPSRVIPPAPFALGIFQIGAHVYAQADLNGDSPIYASCIAGVTGTNHDV